MNKGKLKTFILVFLFISSILLTQQLFVDFSYNYLPSFRQGEDINGNNDLVSNIFLPEKFLINYSEKNHTIIYHDEYHLWSHSQKVLKDVFKINNIKAEKISMDEFLKYKALKSIDIQFSQEIPLYILAKTLNTYIESSIHSEINVIDNIFIFLGEDNFIVLSNKDKNIKLNNIDVNTSKIRDIVDNIKDSDYIRYYPGNILLGTKKGVYAPIEIKDEFDSIRVKNKINIDNTREIQKIAEKFLNIDSDYIRKIEENNDAMIFMYSDKGLVIYPNGLLEYYNKLQKNITERDLYSSLLTAVDFIKQKNRCTNDIYLEYIEEIERDNNKGYKFGFNYKIQGKTVYFNNKILNNTDTRMNSSIEIEVFNEYIGTYREYLREVQSYKMQDIKKSKPLLVPQQVIEKNFSYIKNNFINEKILNTKKLNGKVIKYDMLSSIKNISIGYYDSCQNRNGDKLIMVWVIEIGEKTYIFDMNNGNIVDSI